METISGCRLFSFYPPSNYCNLIEGCRSLANLKVSWSSKQIEQWMFRNANPFRLLKGIKWLWDSTFALPIVNIKAKCKRLLSSLGHGNNILALLVLALSFIPMRPSHSALVKQISWILYRLLHLKQHIRICIMKSSQLLSLSNVTYLCNSRICNPLTNYSNC